MSSIKWLHISDVHVKGEETDFNQDTVLQALWEDIRFRAERVDPDLETIDFVIISGDLSFSGKKKEYELAKRVFIDPLCDICGISTNQIFLVPGNHDVNRPLADRYKDKCKILATILSGANRVTECLETEASRKPFFWRLKPFRKFIEQEFAHITLRDEGWFWGKIVYVDGISVGLAGLDSAWMAYGGKKDYGKLVLGERQVGGALELIRHADIKVAIMHHPLEWFTPSDDTYSCENRLRRDCHFLLHGHLHRENVQRDATLEGNIIVIPAGSIYQGRKYPNSYNYVILHPKKGLGTVFLRRYVDRKLGWQKDTDATGDEHPGFWAIRLPKFTKLTVTETILKICTNIPQKEAFIGRKIDLDEVVKALQIETSIVCITGMPGVGKSDLAIASGKAASEAGLFELTVWTKDYDGTLKLNDVLDEIILMFNAVHATKLPSSTKQSFVRDLLRSHRCLIIIDNFETITDRSIENFASACPYPSRFLLTSREKKQPEGAHIVPLLPMTDPDAMSLLGYFADRAGLLSLSADMSHLQSLAEVTGRNPLAMKWAIAQIAYVGQSVEAVLSSLKEARGKVFDSLFAKAWHCMSPSSHLLLEIAAMLSTPARIDTLKSIAHLDRSETEKALGQPVMLSLLDPGFEILENKRRYAMHPLTQAFVRQKLSRDVNTAEKIKSAAIKYWLEFSKLHGGMRWDWKGYEELVNEAENIFAALRWCVYSGRWNDVKTFRNYLSNGLSIRGMWEKRLELAKLAIIAAEKMDDALTEAWCMVYDLAYTHLKRGELPLAEKLTKRGLRIFRRKNEKLGIAASYHHLGKIEETRRNFSQARNYYRRSLKFYRQDEEYGVFLLSELATVDFKEENLSSAKRQFQEALEKARTKLGKCEIVVARCLGYLGEIMQREGDVRGAKENFESALHVARNIGRADEIALNAFRMSCLLHAQHESTVALSFAKEALSTYKQMGDLIGEKEVANLIAEIEQK